MSSNVWISGESPPCTQRNCWFMRAARGKQSNASMHASYTRSVYLILPEKTQKSGYQDEQNLKIMSISFSMHHTHSCVYLILPEKKWKSRCQDPVSVQYNHQNFADSVFQCIMHMLNVPGAWFYFKSEQMRMSAAALCKIIKILTISKRFFCDC